MNKVDTLIFLEEYQTNSCPIKFVCVDSEQEAVNYYVKFPNEPLHDLVAYEVIATRLAAIVGINVPQMAMVNVTEGSFAPKNLRKNPRVKVGSIGLGSKEIKNITMLSQMVMVKGKRAFQSYHDPLDLISIAVLDMHLNNHDRREQNFNLLLTRDGKHKLYAIDHMACFGGEALIGKIRPNIEVNRDLSLLRANFSRQLMSFVTKRQVEERVEHYFCTLTNERIEQEVQIINHELHGSWGFSEGMFDKVIAFLTNRNRSEKIQLHVNHLLNGITKRS
jgi:hypothetical protein